jgi:hypothetical protein
MNFVLSVFSCIWCKYRFPSLWWNAIVIPILKPGRTRLWPPNIAQSLTSCTCRLLECMGTHCPIWELESENMLSYVHCWHHMIVGHLVLLEQHIQTAFGCCIPWPWRGLPNSLAIHNSMYISYEWSEWAFANISVELYDGSSVLCLLGNPTVITVYPGQCHDIRIHFYVTFFAIAINNITNRVGHQIQSSVGTDDFTMCYQSMNIPTMGQQLQLAINGLSE